LAVFTLFNISANKFLPLNEPLNDTLSLGFILKTDFWVARTKPVFKSPLFRLSLALPLVVGFLLAMSIFNAENLTTDMFGGKKSIDLFWEYMKVPIALSSLSIPLVSWVIANHRSSQLVETIEKQEVKRLHDLYYDHSEYFSKTFGRFVETHYWKYIEREDLYLIHRQLYFHNLEKQKEIFEPNEIVINGIQTYCRDINESFDSFIQDFTMLADAKKENELDLLCYNFTIYLRDRLMMLVANLGCRPLLPSSNLQILLSASVEITSLYQWIVADYEAQRFNGVNEEIANKIAYLVMGHLGVDKAEDIKPSIIENHGVIRDLKAKGAI
jgi:hypothetical protein